MPQLKPQVVCTNLSDHITSIYSILDQVHLQSAGREAIITSCRDGSHMSGSKHYSREALDLRTRDLTAGVIDSLVTGLRNALGSDYDVLFEGDHIHIEYDP